MPTPYTNPVPNPQRAQNPSAPQQPPTSPTLTSPAAASRLAGTFQTPGETTHAQAAMQSPPIAPTPASYQAQPEVHPQAPPPNHGYAGTVTSNTTSVVVHNSLVAPKSVGLAAFLAMFFGPLGMLYATVPGALVMFGTNLFIGLIALLTFGLGAVLFIGTWFTGVIWAVLAASKHNQRGSSTTMAVGTGVVSA